MKKSKALIALCIIIILCAALPGCQKQTHDPFSGAWEGYSELSGCKYPANVNISALPGGGYTLELTLYGADTAYVQVMDSAEGQIWARDAKDSFYGSILTDGEGQEQLSCTLIMSDGSSQLQLWRQGTGHALQAPVLGAVSDIRGLYACTLTRSGADAPKSQSFAGFSRGAYEGSLDIAPTNDASSYTATVSAFGGVYAVPCAMDDLGYLSGALALDGEGTLLFDGRTMLNADGNTVFIGMVSVVYGTESVDFILRGAMQ